MKLKFKITKSMMILLSILMVGLFMSPMINNFNILEKFEPMNYSMLDENKKKEGKKEGKEEEEKNNSGKYPESITQPILDSYPIQTEPTMKSGTDIWKDYPIFGLQSVKQITNNLKHVNNPDNGSCTPAIFCDAFYKKIPVESNEICQLPPVENGSTARVGYFRSR